MVKYTISTFGVTREITGSRVVELEAAQELTVSKLRLELGGIYPDLSKLRSLAVAVNGRIAGDDEIVRTGVEIALIPPVSGG